MLVSLDLYDVLFAFCAEVDFIDSTFVLFLKQYLSPYHCVSADITTINAIVSIWEKIHQEGIASFLVTRQLNQDPLENFFGSIRQQGGNSDNPTPIQLIRAYRKLFHVDLLTVASNCEIDDNKLMAGLQHLDDKPHIFPSSDNSEPIEILSTDYASEHIQKRIVKANSLAYIAGFLLRKTFMRHKCEACSILVNDDLELCNSAFLDFKAYDGDSSSFGGLTAPSEIMLTYITSLEDLFVTYFKSLKQTKNVAADLIKRLQKVELNIPCANFDKNFLVKLFVRMRIYYCLKFENQNLGKSKKRKNRKYIKVAHL